MTARGLTEAFDRWAFRGWPVTGEGLAVVRIVYAGIGLLVGAPHWTWAGRLPDAIWNPEPGPLRLLPGPPGPLVMLALQLAFVTALFALLVGWRTTQVSIAVTVLAATGYGITYGLGNYDHSFMGVLAPAVLAWSGWGACWSVDSAQGCRTRIEGWPVRLLAWLLGLAMLTSAYPKLHAGWWHLHSHAVLGQLANQYYVHGRQALLATASIHLPGGGWWELLDDATLLVEGGFVLAVLSVRGTRIWAAMAAVFHAAILLMINIPFSANVLVYVAFVDWAPVARRVTPMPRAAAVASHRFAGAFVLLGGAGTAAFCAAFGSPLPAVLSIWSDRADFLAQVPLMLAAGAVGLGYLLTQLAALAERLLSATKSTSAGPDTWIASR